VDADLWRRFSLLVLRERGKRKKNEVIAEILRDYIDGRGFTGEPVQLEHILRLEEEREAFLKIRDKLVQDPRYNGKFVAIFRGSVVDFSNDKSKLAKRAYEKHGYVPIYIELVAPHERRVEIPSPESISREV